MAMRRHEQWSSDSYGSPQEGPAPGPSSAPTNSPAMAPPYPTSAPLHPGPLPRPGYPAPPSAGAVLPQPGAGPYMAPVVAVVLPNFPPYPTYPQGAGLVAPTPPYFLPPFNPAGLGPSPSCVGPSPSGFGPSPFSPAFPGPALLPQAPPPPPVQPAPSPGAVDPPSQLFSSSRSSSPLQLNLLQEELPKPSRPPGGAAGAESQEEAPQNGVSDRQADRQTPPSGKITKTSQSKGPGC